MLQPGKKLRMLLLSEKGQLCEVGEAFGDSRRLLPPSLRDDKAVALGVVRASPTRLAPFIHEKNKQC